MKETSDSIYLNSEDDLFLSEMIGFGSQGTVYKFKDEAIKYFAFEIDEEDRDEHKYRYFQNLKISNISFPKKLVFIGNRFSGYTMPLFKGDDMWKVPFMRSFETLKKAILKNEKNSEMLSEYKIKYDDLYIANVIYQRQFKFIDVDSYIYDKKASYQECSDFNNLQLNQLYTSIVNHGLGIGKFYCRIFLKSAEEKLDKGNISIFEYIDMVKNYLSEMSGSEIETIAQGKKVLQKQISIMDKRVLK